jgi:hypothetical protein
MERYRMAAIRGILGALQPVTELLTATDHAAAVGSNQQVVAWQQGRRFRADVGEDETACILGVKRRMLNPLFERAVFRFGGLLQTFAAPVVEPAVVTTPDTIIFDAPELE